MPDYKLSSDEDDAYKPHTREEMKGLVSPEMERRPEPQVPYSRSSVTSDSPWPGCANTAGPFLCLANLVRVR